MWGTGKYAIGIVLLASVISPCLAQAQMVVDSKGNVYVAEAAEGVGAPAEYYAYVLRKYNTSGALLWERPYERTPEDPEKQFVLYPQRLTFDAAGNILIQGSYSGQVIGSSVVKISPEGSVVWSRRLQHADSMMLAGAMMLTDEVGSVYLSGTTVGNSSFFALKLSPEGEVLWGRTHDEYQVRRGNVFSDASHSPNDNLLLVGVGYGPTSGRIVLLNYGIDSELVWRATRTKDTGTYRGWDHPRSVHSVDGEFLVVVDQYRPEGEDGYVLVRYNAEGQVEWVKGSEGGSTTRITTVDEAGNLYVVEASGSVAKYNAQGALLWRTIVGPDAWLYRIGKAESGVIYVGGRVSNPHELGTTGNDYFLIKLDQEGKEQWRRIYDTPTGDPEYWVDDNLETVCLDASGNVYISGNSATIKYGSEGEQEWVIPYEVFHQGVPNAPDAAPTSFALSAPYPNPFAERAQVSLTLEEAGEVTVEVLDVLGRRVALLHAGALPPGAHAFAVEGADWPAGVYLVRAVGPDGWDTRTLVRR